MAPPLRKCQFRPSPWMTPEPQQLAYLHKSCVTSGPLYQGGQFIGRASMTARHCWFLPSFCRVTRNRALFSLVTRTWSRDSRELGKLSWAQERSNRKLFASSGRDSSESQMERPVGFSLLKDWLKSPDTSYVIVLTPLGRIWKRFHSTDPFMRKRHRWKWI